jgi:hypothetical protein
MESTSETSEDDVQPVVAPSLAPNEASAPTSAATPTATSPNAAAAPKRDEDMTLFGPALLLTGEDPDSREKLYAAVIAAVVPADIFEQIWTRDIVDHEWNILRLRRLWAGLFTATQLQGLANVLRSLTSKDILGVDYSKVELLALKFTLHHTEAVKEVKGLLETARMPWEAVLAQTMTFKAETFERIDRMCMTAEARRDAALREIDRRRTSFGERVRRALDQLKPGEFFRSEPSGRITVGRDYDQPA